MSGAEDVPGQDPVGSASALAALAAGVEERQLVVIRVGKEAYGIPIGSVQEIIRRQRVTPVPGARAGVEGVINLRGRVIAVMDLRLTLGAAVSEASGEERIVVVEAGGQVVGLIVDAVTEVLRVPEAAIEGPEAAAGDHASYVAGIAKLPDRLITLLDPDRLL